MTRLFISIRCGLQSLGIIITCYLAWLVLASQVHFPSGDRIPPTSNGDRLESRALAEIYPPQHQKHHKNDSERSQMKSAFNSPLNSNRTRHSLVIVENATMRSIGDVLASKPSPNSLASILPKERFVILTLAVDKPVIGAKMRPAVNSKRCYCQLHGYDCVLDQRPATHTRTVHWTRIPSLQELIQKSGSQYDWIVYMDIDTIITNWTIKLEDFTKRASSKTQLIFHDGPHINSGVFFMRPSAWSLRFLDKWWRYGTLARQFQYDQGPLWWLLLDTIKETTGYVGYQGQCTSGVEREAERCFDTWMTRMAGPFGQRGMSNSPVLFWPCDGFGSTLRGFNFYGHSAWLRHRCQHWKSGDFLAHTHDTYEFDIGLMSDQCPNPWRSYLHVEYSVR